MHSNPNYLFFLQGSANTAYTTLEDSSGGDFALQSFWLAGSLSGNCDTSVTITGSINGGPPLPACAVAPFIVSGRVGPVQVAFNPLCLATTVTIAATLTTQFCDTNTFITLDDVTVCPTTSTSGIYIEQGLQ